MIQACLFDLGNVLLFFSHERMWRQMGEVMGLPADAVRDLLARDDLQWRYEAGEVSTAELVQAMRASARRPFEDAALLHAASDIFEPNRAMLPVLSGLKERGLRLVIVSNTNEAHMAFAEARYDCFRYFDARVYSYDVRAMKPHAAYYEAALAAAGVPRERCLFTDDLHANVDGAARFGFDAVLFEGAEGFRAALGARGLG